MRLNGATLAATVAAFPIAGISEVITVTAYRSTCAAIYTTGTSTYTVIQSTAATSSTGLVSPSPSPSVSSLTDAALNEGTPFLVSIQPGVPSKSRRRQASSGTYLTADGYTTTNPSQAVSFQILNGTLRSITGGWISTDGTVDNMPFAVSAIVQSISTSFFSSSLTIAWKNTAFEDDAADFFTSSTGNGTRVVVRFRGEADPSWTAVSFAAQSTGGFALVTSTTAGPFVATIISQGSTTVSYTPSASPTGNVSPDGACGGTSSFNCYGAPSGNCCSQYGYCGSGSKYCETGCQAGFGECDAVASSSSAILPASTEQAPSPGASTPVDIASSSPGAPLPASSSPVQGVSSAAPAPSSYPAASSDVIVTSTGWSSTISLVTATSLSVTVSSGVSVTHSVTYMSTTSITLPFFSTAATPIGPNYPNTGSNTAQAASTSSEDAGSSSPFSILPIGSTSTSTSYANGASPPPYQSSSLRASAQISSVPMAPGTSTQMSIIPVGPTSTSTSYANGASPPPVVTSLSSLAPIVSSSIPAYSSPAPVVSSSSILSSSAASIASSVSSIRSTVASISSAVQSSSAIPSAYSSVASSVSSTRSSVASSISSAAQSSAPIPPAYSSTLAATQSSVVIPPTYSSSVSSIRSSVASSISSAAQSSIIVPPAYSSTSAAAPPSIAAPSAYSSVRSSVASIRSSVASSVSSAAQSSAVAPPAYSSTLAAVTTSAQASSTSVTSYPTTYPDICPGYNQSTYVNWYGNSYDIVCQSDYRGGSGPSQNVASFEACLELCDVYGTQCSAVAFNGGNGAGTCYMKLYYGSFYWSTSNVTNAAQKISGGAYTPTPSASSSIRASTTSSQRVANSATVSVVTVSPSPAPTTTSRPVSSSSIRPSSLSTRTSSSSAYLVLPSPTPCNFGDPPDYNEDDSYCEIDLPTVMTLYANSDTRTYASANGYLSLSRGSAQYQAQTFPNSNLPNSTLGPYFDDLKVWGGLTPRQGIYYQLDGAGVTYEWYLGKATQDTTGKTQIEHFTLRYDYNTPGVVTYRYYWLNDGENGSMAAVGVQGVNSAGTLVGTTFSFQQQGGVSPGMVVRCDTTTNSCAQQS